jgi:hypothetical protein
MRYRAFVSAAAVAILIASVPMMVPLAGQQTPQAPAAAAAQPFAPPPSSYTPPKTPWGDPDFQGIWDYQSIVPMQRPPQLAGKATMTDAEWEEYFKSNQRNQDACGVATRAEEDCTPEQLASVGAYNEFWDNRNIIKDPRTSLIVDPPDGRIPAMTEMATKRRATLVGATRAGVEGPERATYLSWEEFPTVSRCISEQTPNGPQMYNSGVVWQQSPGWIVMFRERLDTRVIALDGRQHVDSNIRMWNGHSVGRFVGNTLVVETTNFTDKQFMGGVGSTIPAGVPLGNVHVVEHFVPVSATRMHYYATITDQSTWARPWTFMLPWEKDPSYQVFEFACHEGNLSIGNALRGERQKEAAEAAGITTKSKLPADQLSGSLVGKTEAEVRALLGAPGTTRQEEWSYPTVGGIIVLNVYLADGKVKFARPDDLPLADIRKR